MASKRRSAAEWSRIIAKFRRSGLTQRAFCEREDLSLSALQNWLYRPSNNETSANFVEVVKLDRHDLARPRTAKVRVAELEVTIDVDDVGRVVVDLLDALEQRGPTR